MQAPHAVSVERHAALTQSPVTETWYSGVDGSDGIEAQSLGPLLLQCFDTVGWVF